MRSLHLSRILCKVLTWVYIFVSIMPDSRGQEVKMDGTNMFEGRPFFIRCTLQLDVQNDPKYRTGAFMMVHSNRKNCMVTGFMEENGCKDEPNENLHIQDGSCGCSANWNNMGILFRFYYFIEKVTGTIDGGSNFRCSIDGVQNDRIQSFAIIRVFSPVEKTDEMPIIHVCPGKTAEMKFKFKPRSKEAQKDYPFREVLVKKDKAEVARFPSQDGHKLDPIRIKPNSPYKDRIKLTKTSDSNVTLVIQNVQHKDSGNYRIYVKYKGTKREIMPPKIPLLDNAMTNPRPTTTTTTPTMPACESNCTTPDETTPTTTTSTTTTTTTTTTNTTTTNTTTTNTTTTTIRPQLPTETVSTPKPIIERQHRFYFRFDRTLIVTQPPTFIEELSGAIISFKYADVQDAKEVIFTCQITSSGGKKNSMISEGEPPVQLSLYHGYKHLKTQRASSPLSYRLTDFDVNKRSKCLLTGPSLDCLGKNDPRKVAVYLHVEDESKSPVAVSFNIILYTLSILINMVLLWWTIWLVTHHVNLIVKRRKKLAIYRDKILLKHRANEPDSIK